MLEDKSTFFLPVTDEEDIEFLPVMDDEEDQESQKTDFGEVLPVIPLRNSVLFPGVIMPITVGRDKSIRAVKEAYKGSKFIGVISQQDPTLEEPEGSDLFTIGTIAKIAKMIKMPDGTNTVIIQGKARFEVREFIAEDPILKASIQVKRDPRPDKSPELTATVSTLKELSKDIIKLSPNIPSEASSVINNINNPVFLTHFIASNLNSENNKKQNVLETANLLERAQLVLQYMTEELQMLELKNEIQHKVQTDIEKQQRDYFLNQQLKSIQEELGGDAFDKEVKRLKEAALTKEFPLEVKETFERELNKLERTNPAAAEYGVILNYLDLLIDLPWNEFTEDHLDILEAKKILDRDHFGLNKVKDRVLEYLAVLKLKKDLKSPILCFVGPPGVGKTSLGKSIATALGRKYVRMALGGLHDESEIRGHRKTYIGAMPGRVVQSLKKAKSSNPVFILDEVDKIGKDFRGDPSSALLEVLDPEQNHAFYDNYLELEYDLSKVMFIATANSLNTIQPALRDRMEIIFIEGYSLEEKVEIANRHLVPKQREAHGLKAKDIKISKTILGKMIHDYTRESGVRELDRTLASVMRNTAKSVAMEEEYNTSISDEKLEDILGKKKYDSTIYSEVNPPGVATGLAYTQVGGDILFIETTLSRGKGGLTLTGNLGDVMKESASTATTFLKANAGKLGINPDIFEKVNLHLHVPEGAIPKDGPSAGITILSALTSLMTQRRVRPFLGMTGEITLRGKVLPVGGIKEKILAAKRAGIKEIILCEINRKDIEEIERDYIKGMKFRYVNRMEEVIELALEKKPIKDALDIEAIAALEKTKA